MSFISLDEAPAVEGENWHPVLRGMAHAANEMIDAGSPRGWDLLFACAVLNGLPSFARRHVRAERDS